ncbi:ABC transporter ATP-binding protein [Companilactobacillus nuruki]|uniref:ABC transporter ATP-binding protein n=1 Tax=Companilactobacillus nuruki TaxID=1993540 RepID=A0A2N7ASR6_9LACO|nr:ABC transporter ATP-binding protein [Companilactobacillus nuruki]
MVNTILKEADLFCPNSVRINFTIYHFPIKISHQQRLTKSHYKLDNTLEVGDKIV